MAGMKFNQSGFTQSIGDQRFPPSVDIHPGDKVITQVYVIEAPFFFNG